MGKAKRDQLQSWNILIFDPQKTDVDEHIDLINTLGAMLGQTAESKMEKFIDTMSTIIQTHLITCKTWAKTTKKAKELEHIIRKCDPPAAELPNLTKGTAVPSLHLHIAHSNDKEETDIPQPLKGAQPKQPKTRGGPPKARPENPNSNLKGTTVATTCTTQPHKTIKIPSSDIASRELVSKINVECKQSDRLTVAKLNTTSKP